MSEEELHRPSNQTDFKVEVNGQVQVQVLVHLHCSALWVDHIVKVDRFQVKSLKN